MNVRHTANGTDVTLDGFGPTTLYINPSAISVSDALIAKIEYDWGNGEITTISRKLDLTSLTDTDNYAFQADLGDPRNIIVSQDYVPPESGTENGVSINIWVTYFDTTAAELNSTVILDMYRVSLVDNGINQGYAEDMHLAVSRIWGPDNQKMLFIETIGPTNAFAVVPLSSGTVTVLTNGVIERWLDNDYVRVTDTDVIRAF